MFGSIAVAALLGALIEGRLVPGLIAFGLVASIAALALERRRRRGP